jgi:hypothetical protein
MILAQPGDTPPDLGMMSKSQESPLAQLGRGDQAGVIVDDAICAWSRGSFT